MIQTKFIFPNFGGKTHSIEVEKTCRIADLKENVVRKIMEENNYKKDGQESKIRLFHLGSELQEGNTLQEYCKNTESEGTQEVILHVFMSHLKAQNINSSSNHIKRDKRNESVCNCNIF